MCLHGGRRLKELTAHTFDTCLHVLLQVMTVKPFVLFRQEKERGLNMKPSRLALTTKKYVMKWYRRYFNQIWLPIHPKTGLQLFPPGRLHKNIKKQKNKNCKLSLM